ncbi:hypothetical protein EWB00_007545, partial [Schistosoma japonicum]
MNWMLKQLLLNFPPTVISTASTGHSNYSTFTHSPSLSNQLSTLHINDELSSFISQPTSKKPIVTTTSTITNMHCITSNAHNNVNYHDVNNPSAINGIQKRYLNDLSQMNNRYVELDCASSSSRPSSTFVNCYTEIEPSFPLPPPNPLTLDNFPLPPPPLPPTLTPRAAALPTTLSTNYSQTLTSFTYTESTTSDACKHLSRQYNSSTNGHSDCHLVDPKSQLKSPVNSYGANNDGRNKHPTHNTSTTNSRKPSIPQRAPSTRLTSLPNWPKHDVIESPNLNMLTTSNVTFNENKEKDNLKTEYSMKSSNANNTDDSNHSVECTTLPVQDIIRKFGNLLMSNAKIPNQCNTTSNTQCTLSSVIPSNSINCCIPYTNSDNDNHIKRSVNNKYNQPTQSVNSHCSLATGSPATPITFISQNKLIQESVVISTTSSSSSSPSSFCIHTSQSNSPDMNQSHQVNTPKYTKLSKRNYCTNNNNNNNNTLHTLSYPFSTSSSTVTASNLDKPCINSLCISGKFVHDKCCSTATNYSLNTYQSTSTFHSNETNSSTQINSSSTPTFTSTSRNTPGELSKLQNHIKSAHCTSIITSTDNVNNSTNGHTYSQQQQPLQQHRQLDPHVVHQLNGTLLQRRLSSDSSSNSSFISVQSMDLDPQILGLFKQFNIVDATQIPGYHPIPSGLPEWKIHRLERKNRDAINVYADELKRWGLVPNWKRELIEKRQLNKM